MSRTALIFNIGVLVGLLLMVVGAGLIAGVAAALLVAGVVVWLTTVIATHFATKGSP